MGSLTCKERKSKGSRLLCVKAGRDGFLDEDALRRLDRSRPTMFLECSRSASANELHFDVTRMTPLPQYLKNLLNGDDAAFLAAQIKQMIDTCSEQGFPLMNIVQDVNRVYYDTWKSRLMFVYAPFVGVRPDLAKMQSFFASLLRDAQPADERAALVVSAYNSFFATSPTFNPAAVSQMLESVIGPASASQNGFARTVGAHAAASQPFVGTGIDSPTSILGGGFEPSADDATTVLGGSAPYGAVEPEFDPVPEPEPDPEPLPSDEGTTVLSSMAAPVEPPAGSDDSTTVLGAIPPEAVGPKHAASENADVDASFWRPAEPARRKGLHEGNGTPAWRGKHAVVDPGTGVLGMVPWDAPSPTSSQDVPSPFEMQPEQPVAPKPERDVAQDVADEQAAEPVADQVAEARRAEIHLDRGTGVAEPTAEQAAEPAAEQAVARVDDEPELPEQPERPAAPEEPEAADAPVVAQSEAEPPVAAPTVNPTTVLGELPFETVDRKPEPAPLASAVEPDPVSDEPKPTLQLDPDPAPAADPAPVVPAPAEPEPAPTFWLTHERSGERVQLHGDRFVVGKSKHSNYQVRGTTTVSRSHALFCVDDEGCWIEDDDSRNGTFVNNERLAPGVRRRVVDGDVIRMSDETFTIKQDRR